MPTPIEFHFDFSSPYSYIASEQIEPVAKRYGRSVDYKLCYRNGRWRVYDVVVEGVSLVDDYREQFARIIAQDSYDGLVKRMRKRLGDTVHD